MIFDCWFVVIVQVTGAMRLNMDFACVVNTIMNALLQRLRPYPGAHA